ncbi:MAG: hypothetical protein RSA57_03835 [Cetobacterium sp.]|uniref:hypothetical protein n=1 Tax=Bacteria TaxID=2 RepID=UPI002FC8779C
MKLLKKKLTKELKIIIGLSLTLFLGFSLMQTNISFKNRRIKSLESQLRILVYENKTDSVISENQTKDDVVEEDPRTELYKIKERYIKLAEGIGKQYDESLLGEPIYKFEVIDLNTVTDTQVNSGINKLSKERFNIKIEKNKLGNKNYYKIILIE